MRARTHGSGVGDEGAENCSLGAVGNLLLGERRKYALDGGGLWQQKRARDSDHSCCSAERRQEATRAPLKRHANTSTRSFSNDGV